MKRLLLLGLLFFLLMPGTAHSQDATSDLLGRINALRQSLGLSGYSLNNALNSAAQNHANWMASTGQVSHTQPDGSTPTVRAQRAGYGSSWVSENIYMGTHATAATAWQWWLNSPIHYRGITSANYSEVGIGAATGPNGTAFVLVFGNPGAPAVVPRARPGGSSSSGAAPPPSFIVGVDNYGNVMHEIQPDQTLGHIVFLYGYDWEDLERIRQLNQMTEEEGRRLSIGAVLLIPPWDGTYTPTPGEPPTVTPTPGAELAEALAAGSGNPEAGPELDPPEFTPIPTPSPEPEAVGTSAVVPEWVIQTAMAQDNFTAVAPDLLSTSVPSGATAASVSWSAVTVTPTPGTSVAMLADEPQNPASAVIPSQAEVTRDDDGTSPLIIVAIVLQVAILTIAGVEFLRRSRKTPTS